MHAEALLFMLLLDGTSLRVPTAHHGDKMRQLVAVQQILVCALPLPTAVERVLAELGVSASTIHCRQRACCLRRAARGRRRQSVFGCVSFAQHANLASDRASWLHD